MPDEYLRIWTESDAEAGIVPRVLHVEHNVAQNGEVLLALFDLDADCEAVGIQSVVTLSPSAVAQLVGYLRESPVLRAAEAQARRESGGIGEGSDA